MTKELIENIRAIIVPYMAYDLRRINYENMGEIDAEQFSEDMNEILDLATKALEHQPCEDAPSAQPKILACGEGELNVPDINDEKLSEIPTGSESEDKGVLEQLAEKQNNLLAINKMWSDAIEKKGYVN